MALEVLAVFSFEIEADGLPFGVCQEFTPPDTDINAAEYGFGVDTPNIKQPLGQTIGDMTMKNLMIANDTFVNDWISSKSKKNITVRALGTEGSVVRTYDYVGCFVKKYKRPTLKADNKSTDLMMEELTISVDNVIES